jgi:hypothetical protein
MNFASSRTVFNTTPVAFKALVATYQVSGGIARNKKPHTTTETVILLAALDMIQTMFGEKHAQQFRKYR